MPWNVHHRDTEFTWFDRLTMNGGKPRILSFVEGRASAVSFPISQSQLHIFG